MSELIVDMKIAVPADHIQPRLLEALKRRASLVDMVRIANEIGWKVTVTIEPPEDGKTH